MTKTNKKLTEDEKKIYQKVLEENNPKNDFCAVCGDTDDEVQLINICNFENTNKFLCKDCMKLQTEMYNVKFSIVINNRACIMKNIKK